MRRLAVLLAIAGCDEPADEAAAPRSWVVEPGPMPWELGPRVGAIGRSQAPVPAVREGISGAPHGAIALPTVWAVGDQGAAAQAIVYGTAGGAPAIELVEIDKGVVLWRDVTACGGPVVGVTRDAVVCADSRGTRAVSLDGKKRWNHDGATFIAMTGDRIAIAGGGETVVIDASDGDDLAHVKLPAGVTSDSILATCGDAGRELFAYGQDGRLVHIAEAAGGPKAAWALPLDTVVAIDACDGAAVIVTISTATGPALVAIGRDTGAIVARIDDVRGYWPARDGSDRIEVSTGAGVARYGRDLTASEHVALPVLGELLAKRGDQRLVRATATTAALLDKAGVRAYLPLAKLGAALGDRSILAASWLGSPGEVVMRLAIPDRYRRALRLPPARAGIAVPAELRDLPDVVETGEGTGGTVPAIDKVAAVALDPADPAAVIAAGVEAPPTAAADDDPRSILARFDLRTRALTWSHVEGCGPGTAVGVAVARGALVCATRGKASSVHATARDGSAMWQWSTANVDAVRAGGDVVLAFDADRMTALDARDGRVLGRFASDDGAAVHAALVEVDGMTVLAVAERGRVVARLPLAHMLPLWSLEVDGVVADLAAAGDGVLVALEDGDAYRVDVHTGAALAMPGIGLLWRASGELVTGEAPGGPIPPDHDWLPPPPKLPPRRVAAAPKEKDPDAPPELPKPWPAPPPMRASWQYTLYELTGALRTRNDYALAEPVLPASSRQSGAPLVVQSGVGLRDMLVLDPDRGDPLRRARVPETTSPPVPFSTVVDGKALVGAVLPNPLRVVLF